LICKHQQRLEGRPKYLFPAGKAAEVVAERPVLPILLLLVAGGEVPPFDVDQPRLATRRRDDEVEVLVNMIKRF
jgi:hypothetical protein